MLQTLNTGTYIFAEHSRLTRSVAFPSEILVFGAAGSRLIEFVAEIALVLVALVLLHHGRVPASFVLLPVLVLIQLLLVIGLALPDRDPVGLLLRRPSRAADRAHHAVLPFPGVLSGRDGARGRPRALLPQPHRRTAHAVSRRALSGPDAVASACSAACSPARSSSTCSAMPSSAATPRSSPRSSEMAAAPAVELRGVSKRFYFYEHRTSSLREWFIRRVLRRPLHVRRADSPSGTRPRVEPGEAVALLGRNGSGKSTALRLIAGIYQPSTGTVETHGRITAVIELGAGFHPELTGAENVALYAAVLGLTRRELARALRRDRRVRRHRATSSTRRSSTTPPAWRRGSPSRWRCASSRTSCCSTRCSRWATRRSGSAASSGCGLSRARRHPDPGLPRARSGARALHPRSGWTTAGW